MKSRLAAGVPGRLPLAALAAGLACAVAPARAATPRTVPSMVYAVEAYALDPGAVAVEQWGEWRSFREEDVGVFQSEVLVGLAEGLQLKVRAAELELSRGESGRRAVRFNESALELTWELFRGGEKGKGPAWAVSFVPGVAVGPDHCTVMPQFVGELDWAGWGAVINTGFSTSWSGERLSALHADSEVLTNNLGVVRHLADWVAVGVEAGIETEWTDHERIEETHVSAGPCVYFMHGDAYCVVGYRRNLSALTHQARGILRVGAGVEF